MCRPGRRCNSHLHAAAAKRAGVNKAASGMYDLSSIPSVVKVQMEAEVQTGHDDDLLDELRDAPLEWRMTYLASQMSDINDLRFHVLASRGYSFGSRGPITDPSGNIVDPYAVDVSEELIEVLGLRAEGDISIESCLDIGQARRKAEMRLASRGAAASEEALDAETKAVLGEMGWRPHPIYDIYGEMKRDWLEMSESERRLGPHDPRGLRIPHPGMESVAREYESLLRGGARNV